MPSPLPLDLLTSGRTLTEPRLAPIGRPQVAFVQRLGSAASINAVWLDEPGPERMLTFGPSPAPGRDLSGGCYTWVARRSELSIVYVAVDGGLWWQRGHRLDRLDAPVGSDVDGRSRRAPSVDRAGSILVYAIDEAEVWAVDLDAVADGVDPADARRRLDDGGHEFCFDPAVAPDGGTVSWQAWNPPHMPWDESVRVDLDLVANERQVRHHPDAAIQQPRFASDGRPVQVDDRSGWLNVSDADGPLVSEPVEHAGPTWGMGARSYAVDPDGARLAVTRNERGFGGLDVVDQGGGERRLGRGVHGHLDWVGDTIVALRTGARTPTQVVAYRVSTGERTIVATSGVDAWPLLDLPEPSLVEVESDDGVTLHARRYGEDSGRLLVWIHGGPTGQWPVEWRPRLHYWWSRGWDVLVVDPRGTTGHGRSYQQALHGSWGRLDVDDTATMIRQAHRQGWADPATTVVVGGSSGGLTVLGVLADHGHLVAGGLASYPVSDVRALADATHRFEAHYTDTLVAPNDGSAASEERFRELSPSSRAAEIAAPLLVFHGTEDPVVPIDQSRRLIDRIRSARPDADVALVEYEGEGHGFRQPEHVVDEHLRTEAFFDRVTLGARDRDSA